MKEFTAIVLACIFAISFAISCTVCVVAPFALIFGTSDTNISEFMFVITSFTYVIYVILTRMRGFAVFECWRELQDEPRYTIVILSVIYVISFIGWLYIL